MQCCVVALSTSYFLATRRVDGDLQVLDLYESKRWKKTKVKDGLINNLSFRFCQNEAWDDPADAQDSSEQNRPDETQERLEMWPGMELCIIEETMWNFGDKPLSSWQI